MRNCGKSFSLPTRAKYKIPTNRYVVALVKLADFNSDMQGIEEHCRFIIKSCGRAFFGVVHGMLTENKLSSSAEIASKCVNSGGMIAKVRR